MKKIAIIGAGIFGSTIAIELSKNKNFDITLIERESDILSVASTTNLLRHHYGYHYPRSEKTALDCQKALKSFEEEYGECISEQFPSYYAVSNRDSKTTADDYIKFCDKLNLPYEMEWPDKELMDRSKTITCIKTSEPVYDPDKLKEIISLKIKRENIKLKLNSEVVGGVIENNGMKKLKIKSSDDIYEDNFDYVIAAMYSNFNQLNKWFNFPRDNLRYSLFEVLEIELPIKYKIGMILVDGNFSAILPNGNKNTFRLANAGDSVLNRIVSDDLDDSILLDIKNRLSNTEGILKIASNYFPIVKKAKLIKSIYIIQVVKAGVENTDERPSDINDKGNGIYSIFSGKVVSCVDIARSLAQVIK